jgi:hypothetical protein
VRCPALAWNAAQAGPAHTGGFVSHPMVSEGIKELRRVAVEAPLVLRSVMSRACAVLGRDPIERAPLP